MNSQQLLFINLFIVVIVALFFGMKRPKRKQSHVQTKPAGLESRAEILEAAVIEIVPPLPPVTAVSQRERIYFVYNGHEWDVFEVLGLKSGVSLEAATRHYQELIKTSDPSTFEFYDAAFSSLLKRRSSSISK